MRQLMMLVALLVAVAACSAEPTVRPEPDPTATPTPTLASDLVLSSPAFSDGQAIPVVHACDDDVTPALEWSGVPTGAVELALTVTDADAPGGEFVHWLVWGLDPASAGLAEGEIPDSATQGRNDFGRSEYGGPCPPPGDGPHRYTFTLFALDTIIDLDGAAGLSALEAALDGTIVAKASLTGTYDR